VTGRGPMGKAPRETRIDKVIADVERRCLERGVYMLGPEKGLFLRGLVEQARPGFVVECGTALGYSGLHILSALQSIGKGRLLTVEIDPIRAREAVKNFFQAGASKLVEVRVGDAAEVLQSIAGSVDFLFLDNNFENYYKSFLAVRPSLSDGALVAADNAGIGGSVMADYLGYVRSRFTSELHWFDTALPWADRDAMEVTVFRTIPP
jgi:predicted O-methyltransferase YrrM